MQLGQLSASCGLHADTWGSELLPSSGSAIRGSFISSCAAGERKHKSRAFKNQAWMYIMWAHSLSARTQPPDPKLTSWIVFKSVVLKKWKNKIESDGHITVSLSQRMSASHGKVPAQVKIMIANFN